MPDRPHECHACHGKVFWRHMVDTAEGRRPLYPEAAPTCRTCHPHAPGDNVDLSYGPEGHA